MCCRENKKGGFLLLAHYRISRCCYYPYFIREQTEAQRGKVNWPNQQRIQSEFRPSTSESTLSITVHADSEWPWPGRENHLASVWLPGGARTMGQLVSFHKQYPEHVCSSGIQAFKTVRTREMKMFFLCFSSLSSWRLESPSEFSLALVVRSASFQGTDNGNDHFFQGSPGLSYN